MSPENSLKDMLGNPEAMPMAMGMAAKVKVFVVNKGLVILISALITASAAGGVAAYKLNESIRYQKELMVELKEMKATIVQQSIKIAEISIEIAYLKKYMHGQVKIAK